MVRPNFLVGCLWVSKGIVLGYDNNMGYPLVNIQKNYGKIHHFLAG